MDRTTTISTVISIFLLFGATAVAQIEIRSAEELAAIASDFCRHPAKLKQVWLYPRSSENCLAS